MGARLGNPTYNLLVSKPEEVRVWFVETNNLILYHAVGLAPRLLTIVINLNE